MIRDGQLQSNHPEKSVDSSVDRRKLLISAALAPLAAQNAMADNKSAKAADETKPAAPVSPDDAEIDRRMASITARFGEHLTPDQAKTVRGDVAANYYRAKRLRAVPLNDFDGPFNAFCPVREGLASTRPEKTNHSPAIIITKPIVLNDDTAFAEIAELAAGLRDKRFTSVELTRFYLARLEKYGPKLNCIATLTRETALKQAAQADARLKAGTPLGLLDGIPYGAKDLLAARGYPTSNGCAPYVKRVVDVDSTVIRRLSEAGAVLVAKLAMVECAGGLGYRQANASAFGPGLTPYNTKHWSGGSSSGSGSAVGAALVPFAIGSETWGSITTPASYCSVTGLRPTYGRVSRAGAYALSYSLDKIGPMARSAADAMLVLKAIAGKDAADTSTHDHPWPGEEISPGHRFKLAVLKDGVAKAQPAVKANFERALAHFRNVADIIEIDLPTGPYADVLLTILAAESASAFEELVDSGLVRQVTAPEDRIGGYADRAVTAADFVRAQRLRGPLCQAFDQYLKPFDAVLSVPTAQTAYPIEKDFGSPYTNKSLGGPGNLCGTPAVVIPTGLDEQGLPTAMQIDTRAFGEPMLVALAGYFQTQTNWHRQRPDLNKL